MEPLPATHLYVISGLVSPCYWRGFEARVHHNLDCCLNHPCGLIYVIDRGRGHLCLYFCRDTGPWGLLSCRADVSVKALSHTHQNEAWRLGDEFRRGSKGEARLGSRGGGEVGGHLLRPLFWRLCQRTVCLDCLYMLIHLLLQALLPQLLHQYLNESYHY